MKKAILILLSLTITLTAGWWKTYGEEDDDAGFCVEKTYDGGFIVAGISGSPRITPMVGDLWLLKTDSIGDTLWTKTYTSALDDGGYCVLQTKDSGYVVTGFTNALGAYKGNLWLLKTNPIGDTLWTKIYGEGEWQEGLFIQETNDGGYIIVGRRGDGAIWLLKTDTLGDTLWARSYTLGDYQDRGFCVRQTSDGGYVIAGEVDFGYTPHLWIIKTDSIGDTLWTCLHHTKDSDQGPGRDKGHCVVETLDGCFVVSGCASNDLGFVADLILIKVDSEGNKLWFRNLGGSAFHDIGYRSSVVEAQDGGYVVTGGPYTLIKCDNNGNKLWERSIVGGGKCIAKLDDGGFIVTGGFERDLFLCKTDSLGLLAVEEQPVAESPSFEVVTAVGKLIVLRFANAGGTRSDCVAIFDATGRLVDELHVPQTGGTITWGEGYRAGVYFIRERSGNPTTHKVVLVQ